MQELVKKSEAKIATTQILTEPQVYPKNYAMAIQNHVPTAHTTVVSKGETSNKQILIQKEPSATDNTLDSLTERDLITKANTAIASWG